MSARNLAEEIIELAHELYPHYTHEQALVWACGFLASMVREKNYMDNIVYERIDARIKELRNPSTDRLIALTDKGFKPAQWTDD